MLSAELSARELKDWLDLLSGSQMGVIKLINTFLSLEHKLVNEDRLHSFFLDCLSCGSKSPDDALVHFEIVSGRPEHSAIAQLAPMSASSASEMTTTIRSDTFHRYILGRPKTRIKVVLLPAPRSRDSSAERAYLDALARTISRKGWYKDSGSLGVPLPYPRHVWFTDQHHLDLKTRADSSSTTQATKVRDALGLIETGRDAYLLSLRFSAKHLYAIPGLKMARPGFADRGNRRFAAYLNKKAESAYRKQWGLTVHLGKLRAKPRRSINGVPERICLAIPLSRLGDYIRVEPLGWVMDERGDVSGIDDDKAFVDRLRGRRKLADMRRRLLSIADKP